VFGIALQGAGTGYGVRSSELVSNDSCDGTCAGSLGARGQQHGRVLRTWREWWNRSCVPLQTHIGEQYGVAKVGNDWVIDFAETVAKVVEITDIVPGDGNFFICKILKTVQGAA
jgi:hypothetical protein